LKRTPLLSRQEWIYSLSLLISLVVYNLILRALDIASLRTNHELAQTLNLMQPVLFFNLGYVAFWIALFAAVPGERRLLRRTLVVLFHLTTMLVVLVSTYIHHSFQETGAAPRYGTIADLILILNFDEIKPILFHDVSLSAWMLLFASLLYVALGPWLLTRAVGRWRGWFEGGSYHIVRDLFFRPSRASVTGSGFMLALAAGWVG